MSLLPMEKFAQFRPDVIVGVSRGGLVPAAIVAGRLGARLVSAHASLYDDSKPAKKLRQAPSVDLQGQGFQGMRVLIIDDISNSGATLDAVKRAVLSTGASDAATFCLLGKSDLSNRPFEGCVKFPWEN